MAETYHLYTPYTITRRVIAEPLEDMPELTEEQRAAIMRRMQRTIDTVVYLAFLGLPTDLVTRDRG